MAVLTNKCWKVNSQLTLDGRSIIIEDEVEIIEDAGHFGKNIIEILIFRIVLQALLF